MEIEQWKQDLFDLVQKAKDEKMLLKCGYQDLIFTAEELQKHHKEGRFMWGVVNWKLITVGEFLLGEIEKIKQQCTDLEKLVNKIY